MSGESGTEPGSRSSEQVTAELDEARRRIAALEAVLAEQSFCMDLVGTMLDGFSLLSPDGFHVEVNDALCRMTGFARDELIGAGPPHPYWPPGERPAIEAAFAATLSGGPQTFPLTFMRKDGTRFPALVTPSLIRDAAGAVTAAYATVKDVTELRRTAADLSESEGLFRLTFEQAPIGAVIAGLDFRFQRVNKRFAELTGYAQDELLALGFPDVTHPDDVATDVAQIGRLEAGEIAEYAREKRYVRKDGSVAWGDVVVRPLKGADGRTIAFVAMIADITKRKDAERALRESEDRFKYIFDHSVVGKSITQLTGEAQVNDAFCEMLGYTREELAHTRWQDLTHPDDIAETERQVELLQSGSADSARYEKRYLARDGSVVWGELSTSVRRDESGAPMYLMSTVLDISARKKSEQLMTVPSEILGIIAAPVPVRETVEGIVAALQRATGFDAVGLRLEQGGDYPFIGSVGYSDEFLTAENVLTTRSPDDELCRNADGSISLECTCGLVISGAADPANPLFTPGGSAWTNDSLVILDIPPDEDPRLHPRNRCIHMGFRSLALVPLRAGDEILGLLHLGDRHADRLPREWITFFEGLGASIGVAIKAQRAGDEIKRLNEQLSHRLVDRIAQLDLANQELESYAYAVSHDVRTPLRAIDGFSAAVLEDEGDKLSPEAAEDLRRVRAAAQEMARLLDDLLGLTNVTRRDLSRRTVDVSALAAEVAEELAAEDPVRRVDVSIAPDLMAEADPTLLRMILRELLGNAWKFTAKHDCAHVEVGALDVGGTLEFYVRDDGAGFDDQYAQHLFGLFQRMHPRGEFPGDGVGLATVQRLVRKHGGSVWAEAEVEKGAIFYFTLPAAAGPAD